MPLRKRLPLKAWIPYAIGAIGVSLTLLGTFYVLRTNRADDEIRFRAAVDEAQHLIEIRLTTYVELLYATAALFAASERVDGPEFRAFVHGLALQERYPGIQGIGYAVRLAPGAFQGVIAELQRQGITDPHVWPPGDRQEYTSIIYLEPLDRRNRAALGYDMFTDVVRRAAMERARDTGLPSASGRLTLVQEIDERKQAGFLIYLPVYRNGAPTDTVEQRRDTLIGWVYSPFRADDLLEGIFESQPRMTPIQMEVYEGDSLSPDTVMHRSADRERAPSPHDLLRTTSTMDVAGRTWTLAFTAPQHFDGSPLWLAPLTFISGLGLSLALFSITLTQYRAWQRAQRQSDALRISEEALRESDTRLRRLVVLEREARAQAQAADQAKDEFLATLSHELRTPLNAILGWLSMLRAGKVREDRRAAALEVIDRNARVQAQLIEDLLDVSRIITGKVRLDSKPVDVGAIALTVLDTMRPSADAKEVRMHPTVARDLRPVNGDPARVQQIIWNLLSNAVKFTPAGGDVFVEVAEDQNEVQIRVRDTGIGIAPEFLPFVFERFRQADSSTTRAHAGVGLGLSIVRHLVELHGGTIAANSEGPERGAVFTVRLPVATVDSARHRERIPAPGVTLSGLRVLVVDDDGDTREMLAEALEAQGARVTTAASAMEALGLLEHGADVLVSDIGMPGLDGYGLIREVRALPGAVGRIPAIALTAYARPEDREAAIAAGYQVFLSKPVEIEQLYASLASVAVHAS